MTGFFRVLLGPIALVLRLQVDTPLDREFEFLAEIDDVHRATFAVAGSGCRPAKRRWRAPIFRTKCMVEPPDAAEPSGEGYLRQRHGRLIDQPLRRLHATGRRDLARGRTRVMQK